MRDEPVNKGRCPVADDAPTLMVQNDLAADFFSDLVRTAKSVAQGRKTLWFIGPMEFQAMCEIMAVTHEDREGLWRKVKVLEEVWNDTRPMAPKEKRRGRAVGARRRR